ncbi:MAG: 50S ribosomal protein L24 [Opitutaceae bacterium]|jgi:large subunit ribosomal protein L24|nr:50S ribosomal protein L24 [Opitutaceae bacterium]OQB97747.1 MAG: 50S ribosomal protein L24 [Verrucomicrobia bacterium ADurb.Bin122]HOD46765.1 50S ribosomal protein L24 [Opitutaceae bacterium]HOG93146.1 50S ribosomal protein L24 [Opitutaceae bacterium]HOR25097.1 50S ribosomal protein L24 [Opitutaceae bacterium]
MQKFHVKRGDEVVVIAGSHKGKSGKVLEVLPAKQRARVEGVAMIKRHLRKSQEHPNGTIAEREGTVHISNLMLKANFEQSRAGKAAAAKA